MLTAHSKLKNLLAVLSHEPREVLLSIKGLGKVNAGNIVSKREEVAQRNGTAAAGLRLLDMIDIPGVGAKKIATLTGSDSTSILEVIKYVVLFQRMCVDCQATSNSQRYLKSVFSLDFGLHESSCCCLDDKFHVLQWEKVPLGLPIPYSPRTCYEKVTTMLKQLPISDAYVFEAQSHQNPKNQGFLAISVQLRVLEAMTFAITNNLRQAPVYSVLPRSVAKYLGISANKSTAKKKAAVELVQQLIDPALPTTSPLGNKVHVPNNLISYFQTEKKKDDLSDCLLQAVAFMEWSQMAAEL